MPSRVLKMMVPFAILLGLIALLWHALFNTHHDLPSALIGESVPDFQLPTLMHPEIKLSNQSLKGHQIVLLNVWSSWCYACALEMPMLLKIRNVYHIAIYGINYKDEPLAAQAWLNKHGNPFITIGQDWRGDVSIDLGVYGAPETFVVNNAGQIIYRHVGVINQATWDQTFAPLLRQNGMTV